MAADTPAPDFSQFIRQRLAVLEAAIETDLQLARLWVQGLAIPPKVQVFLQQVLLQPRMLMIIGAAALGFRLLSGLFYRRSRSPRLGQGGSGGVVVVHSGSKRTALGDMLHLAMRQFLLYMARKMLRDLMQQGPAPKR